MTREARFEYLYKSKHWQQEESDSVSGAGSSIEYTKIYRPQLISLIEKLNVQKIFDAPCGDFNWMSQVMSETQVEYIGGDIVEPLVKRNREVHKGECFLHFDITSDAFPKADLWHCRDCLFHLSSADILLALENFARSDIPYALLTTHRSPELQSNEDIVSGDFRYLDLTKPPFCLPEPTEMLVDYTEADRVRRFVGLWHKSQIQDSLQELRARVHR